MIGSFGVVRWLVWAWPSASGRCWLSPTSLASPQACFVVVSPVAACPRVRLLCCCQHSLWFAVVVAAQWSACPAVRCVGPWWPCRVGSGCSSCVRPAWYVLTLRRPLMVGRVLRGRKVATIGTTAEKHFQLRYDMPCPALEGALHARPIIWHFAVSFQLRLFRSYVHLRRWQGPLGPPGCIPVLPMGAPGCCAYSVLRCLCLCPPVCLFGPLGAGPAVCCIVPCFAGLVVCVSVPQCGFRRFVWPGLCSGVGASRTARRAGLGVTFPCSLAGAGGLVGPVR